ncbi:hypothetical protein [Chryseobacterium terrae]|uniref:Uncharacterized protein n=1 Tax=Chryseobacterium terrae TaxID=3163299 RepID=A0ABW8Y5E0_9FLAO
MKLLLTFLLITCSALVSAQNKELNNEQQNIPDSVLVSKNKKNGLTLKINKKTSSEIKSDVAQNINIVREINTVLNYKVNKIWREDLYCLVCGRNYNSKAA